jgi:hypothetical protein
MVAFLMDLLLRKMGYVVFSHQNFLNFYQSSKAVASCSPHLADSIVTTMPPFVHSCIQWTTPSYMYMYLPVCIQYG